MFVYRMSLGHVYDLDLKKNETLIKDVIIQAQGEVRTLCLQVDNGFAKLQSRWPSKST
jgi:hypothetical protein